MGAIRRSIPITSPFPDCRALLRRSNSNRKYARRASRSVAPRNLVYYQQSVRALNAPPFTPSARRSHEDPRQMAALARMPRSMILRRIGALCIALLVAFAAVSSAAPAHAARPSTTVHCPDTSQPTPTKHPCGGEQCCSLCGHSQKELVFPFLASVSGAIAYAPPRAASRAFCAIQAPTLKTVRAHSRAAPRAPPRFS